MQPNAESPKQMGSGLIAQLRNAPAFLWIALMTVVCVAPFVGRAFYIDDTLFLRVAQQIQKHPADPYGFNMNWYFFERPILASFNNPPLASYYAAFVATIGGWNELALHLGFLPIAILLAWGVYTLAKFYTNQPGIAAAVAVATPVFVLSAVTVMCDLLLTALWVWTLVWFERGLRNGRGRDFFISGVLASLAFLTKFNALALAPLLFVYAAIRQRKVGAWLVALVIPVVAAVIYDYAMHSVYGRSALFDAAGVSAGTVAGHGGHMGERQIIGLSFLGGCFLPILFLVPWLWTTRSVIKGLLVMVPLLLVYPRFGAFSLMWGYQGRPDWVMCAQSALFMISGMHVLLLAVADLWRRRDAVSVLLAMWVFGIFAFAAGLNWTVNGRSILPMLPAVAILVARRLSPSAFEEGPKFKVAWLGPVLAGAALSMLVASADYALALSARTAARDLCQAYPRKGNTLWFQGHWGFQYYMEERGAKCLEMGSTEPDAGDIIVISSEAPNTFDLSTNLVQLVDVVDYRPNRWLSCMNMAVGAGYYASLRGPFPFSLGRVEPEHYYVFMVTQPRGTAKFAPVNPFISEAVLKQFDAVRIMRLCREVLAYEPANADAHFHLGTGYYFQRKPALATKEFSEALRLEPGHKEAELALHKIHE